jgi:hypothetical protein
VGQDLVLRIPLERDADQLGLVAVQPELPDQLPDVVFGAALDERDLSLTDDDAHRTGGAYPLPSPKDTIPGGWAFAPCVTSSEQNT